MKEGEGPFFNPKAEEEKMPEERIFEEGEGVRKDEDEVEDAVEKKPEKLETSKNKNGKIKTDDKEHIKEMKG